MRNRNHRWAQAGAFAALAVLATACSSGSDKVTVTAVDYRFENLPESVKAGTTLTLRNSSSKELHELIVVKLPDTEKRSAEELIKLPEAQFEAISEPPWVSQTLLTLETRMESWDQQSNPLRSAGTRLSSRNGRSGWCSRFGPRQARKAGPCSGWPASSA